MTPQAETSLLPPPATYYGTLRNYVGGRWVDSTSADIRDVVDPATGDVIARVPFSTVAEVDEAVAVAGEAFDGWRRESPVKRARRFFTLKHLLEENLEDLARTLVQEMGKEIPSARGELRRAIEEVECACGIPSLTKGYLQQDIGPALDLDVVYIPRGVFFMVPSFNFPMLVPLEYFPYAVATGNTYIVKPSPQVPISQVRLFELIDECGFPPGVINLVHGDAEVVDTLIASPDTEGFSFVGSTPVGKMLYEKAGRHGKRAQCATGAKNHFVVMPDADLEKTIPAMLTSFFGCAGQRCLAGAVVVAVGDVYEELRDRFVAAARRMIVGNGLDERTTVGPVVSGAARDRITGLIDSGVAEGATILLDGRDVEVPGHPAGAFVGPTVFDDVTPEMTIGREEVFGPVAGIIRVADLDGALELIGNSRFGHSAMIFTSSGAAAREFQAKVTCGNIGINIGVAATQSFATLGGLKESAFGDLHGRSESVLFFTDRKVVVSRWDSSPTGR